MTEKQDFKQYLTKNDDRFSKTDKLNVINLYATSLDDFIIISKQYDVQYLVVNKYSIIHEWYPYIENVYDGDYPFLKEIFDSQNVKYEKLHVKIFEIDYNEFDAYIKKNTD